MRKLLAACSFALFAFVANANAAPFPSLSMDVGVCDPDAPARCIKPDASGAVPVTGTISATLGGFTPSASGARGTPLTVTTSDSSGNLPTGAVVVVSNVGATNPMYCNVNGVAATVSDQLITANGGWFAFTIPAAVTTLHCIGTGGSTTANSLGGAGLATGTGGGSGGGGGGGAITAAIGSYAAGALSAGAFATGAGVDGWDLTQGARADAAWTTGSGSVISLLKAIAAAEIVTNRAVNVAQINGVTVLTGTGAVGTGAQRIAVGTDTATIAGSSPGTAGSASANVVSVQGVASMTPVAGNITQVLGAANSASNGLFVRTGTGQIASGSFASGSVSSGAYAAGALAAGAFATGAGVDGWDLTQGAIADAAVTAGATGSVSAKLRSISRDIGTVATNSALPLPVQTGIGNVNIGAVQSAGSAYETVAASVTGQALGATGATGDYLSHCVIYPATTGAGLVTVFDSTSSATNNVITFTSGTLSNLAPIAIPVGALSLNGAWKVTTGSNVTVTCFGKFT